MDSINPTLELILERTRVKTYPQGQIVIYEGDSPSEVYIVKSGYLKVYDVDKDGNEKVLSIVKPNDVIPYSFFSGGRIPNKWFYQSLCDAEIYVLNRDTLKHAMQADADITLSLVSSFSKEVHELLTRLSSMGKSKTQSKLISVMKYFVVCLETDSTKKWWQVPFPVNHQFLADITGMTRESCAIAMKELTLSKLVRTPKVNLLEINTSKIFDLD